MSISIRALLGLALVTLLASPGLAQTAEKLTASDGPEIVRDVAELADVIRPHPDRDTVDTVLLFTNKTNVGRRVKCIAFGRNGRPVGRAWLRVPGLGLRFAFVSDVANNLDFVGHVQCYAGADVIGSSLLLAAGQVTDLSVDNGAMTSVGRRILFPVAATY